MVVKRSPLLLSAPTVGTYFLRLLVPPARSRAEPGQGVRGAASPPCAAAPSAHRPALPGSQFPPSEWHGSLFGFSLKNFFFNNL